MTYLYLPKCIEESFSIRPQLDSYLLETLLYSLVPTLYQFIVFYILHFLLVPTMVPPVQVQLWYQSHFWQRYVVIM